VDATWEQVDAVTAGRPARRYYRLTPDGLVRSRTAVAALRQQLGTAPAAATKPRPA
jgi:hypothetical protein